MSFRIRAARQIVALNFFVLACVHVHAATVTIEPDYLPANQPITAPGAILSTFRWDGAGPLRSRPVYSIDVGSWAPTGKRVFGHATRFPFETPHHWDNLNHAYSCEHDNVCIARFYVFRVDFEMPTNRVKIRTTVRGELATDGVELWALDKNGDLLVRCHVDGVNNQVLASGVLPPPFYIPSPGVQGQPCGKVLFAKNCPPAGSPDPGNCDYVVSLFIESKLSDIAYVWAGGTSYQGSFAPVDSLTYWLP